MSGVGVSYCSYPVEVYEWYVDRCGSRRWDWRKGTGDEGGRRMADAYLCWTP